MWPLELRHCVPVSAFTLFTRCFWDFITPTARIFRVSALTGSSLTFGMWGSGKYLLWSSSASCFAPGSQWFHDHLPMRLVFTVNAWNVKLKKKSHQVLFKTYCSAPVTCIKMKHSIIPSKKHRVPEFRNLNYATRMMSFVIVWQSESDYWCCIEALRLDLLVLTVEDKWVMKSRAIKIEIRMKQAGSDNSNDRESSSTIKDYAIKVIQATPCWLHARLHWSLQQGIAF